jgi:2-dehydropantoate 2-reductase
MHITFVGPGAIGLFYAARLTEAGTKVSLVLRSDLDAVRRNGIRVKGRDSELHIAPERLRACASGGEAGHTDLVIVTLKNTANDQFQPLISPLLGPETAILTLQNGLGADEQLASLFGAERILGGLSFIACNRTAPGVVECFHPGSITLGEFGRPASDRARAIAALFEKAGIPTKAVESLAEARWRKLIWNIPFNGLSIAAGGITTDRILASPSLALEVRALMDEVAAAAAAQGYSIPEKFILSQIEVTPRLGAYKPSSLIDWAAGRAVEVEAIWGEPLKRAMAAGAQTPRLSLLHALLSGLCPRP